MPVTPEQAAEAVAGKMPLFYFFGADFGSLFSIREIQKFQPDGVAFTKGKWFAQYHAGDVCLEDCFSSEITAWLTEAARIRALVPEVEAMAAEAERRADGAK